MASQNSNPQPTARFTGLAASYAQFRPDYPQDAIEAIISRCRLSESSVLVDVGSGTGISSLMFVLKGIPVIGIEPNEDMRSQAQLQLEQRNSEIPGPRAPLPLEYRAGTAESTGLSDQVADAVLCAQAFHWFRQTEALAEFLRILKPGGQVALMWNERDSSDPFTQAYGDLLQTLADTKAVEVKRGIAGQALLDSQIFVEKELINFSHSQTVSEEGLIGRASSASYVPGAGVERERFEASLRQLFQRFQTDGLVILRYTTSIYFGRRPH